ncbi:YitT family protein [Peribacillus asahii]|uniref:YczE/YyaS/YitT family protein n=1 Tax=Peribacillus asahii TaxID=228899 RepID=UPI003825BF90
MKKLNTPQYLCYGLGILILSLGISFTIQSHLGTSPFDALLIGLSMEIGLTVGSWEIILAFIIIMCNSLLKRHRPEYLGLVSAVLTGVGIDLWLFFLGHFITPEIWFSKLLCFGVGLVLIGFGTAIYLHANFAPIPVDQLMLIIRTLTKTNILFSRTIIYLLFLIMATIFNGPIGVGTVLTVCLGGPILNYFMPIIERRLSSIFSTNTEPLPKINVD